MQSWFANTDWSFGGGVQWLAGRPHIYALILASIFAIGTLGQAGVSRTQEGRVLETARQMANGGWHARLVPYLSGRPRLQKPPLAYWLADTSYAIFGANRFAGRLPFAIASLMTAAICYRIGLRHFGQRAGLLAMCGILGCVIGARFGLVAETDVLTMLWITVAVYAYWNATDVVHSFVKAALWLHLAAIATALTILSKGPPAAFAILFFITYASVRRNWRVFSWMITSGALLSMVLIAAPWFAYIFLEVDRQTIAFELQVAALGGGHRGSFVTYFAYLILDLLPWTAPVAVGFFFAIRQFRHDSRFAALVLWTLTILIPLCLAGQKQRHYLVPLIPPLMLTMGWYVDYAIRSYRPAGHQRFVGWMISCSVGGLAIIGLTLPIAGRSIRGAAMPFDFILALLCLVAGLILYRVRRRFDLGVAVVFTAIIATPLMITFQQVWASSLNRVTSRSIDHELDDAFDSRPRQLIGNDSLALQFELGCLPLVLKTATEIGIAASQRPDTVFIEPVDEDDNVVIDRPNLRLDRTFLWDEESVRIFTVVK